MLHPRLAAAAAVLFAGTVATACAGHAGGVNSIANGDVEEEPRWSARLHPQGDRLLSGSVLITPSSHDNQMVVVISMQGPPSATGALAWRLERGLCGSMGTMVGSPGDYSPVVLRADGSGESTATIAESVPTNGVYRVSVFSSPSPDARLVACGDFSRQTL